MTRLIVPALPLLALALLLNACGGRAIAPTTQSNPPASTFATKLDTIFDNLAAYPSGRYWAFEGSPVQGPDGQKDFAENWRAVAFTPASDTIATVIKVAVALSSGTNGLVVSLNRDDGGVPGKAIVSSRLGSLPAFGSCCTVKAAILDKHVPLTGGTQYWVVVGTDAKEATTSAVWLFNDTDQVDSRLEASYCPKTGNCGVSGSGWTPYQSDAVTGSTLAFAVLGSH
jgi:hypothetical protein